MSCRETLRITSFTAKSRFSPELAFTLFSHSRACPDSASSYGWWVTQYPLPYKGRGGLPGDQQADVGRIPVRYGASDSPLEKRFVPTLLWHILDDSLPGLPGLWTLRIGIGNLICRPTPVAYNRAKQWQALSGTLSSSYIEFFSLLVLSFQDGQM